MSGDAPAVFLGYYPVKTLVVASAYGSVDWVKDQGQSGWFGPAGWKTAANVVYGNAWLSGSVKKGAASYPTGFHFGRDVSPYPGQWIDSVPGIVLEVKDTIKADRSNPNISGGYSHTYQCGEQYYPGNPCIVFSGSATVTLVRIAADLKLVADSPSVQVGSTVKFTNRLENVSVPNTNLRSYVDSLYYVWTPDDTSRGGSAAESIDSSAAACTRQAGDSTCTRVIQGSGTMTIVARVNGKWQEAEVRVNAIPCATGDPVLDHKEVRKALKQMWDSSFADSTAGAGRDSLSCFVNYPNGLRPCGFKRERAVWIIRRNDGSYYGVPVATTYSDECTIDVPWPSPFGIADSLVAIAHSHPSSGKNQEPTYGNCLDVGGVRIQRFPGEAGRRTGYAGIDSLRGGGSRSDWHWTTSAFGLDVYVMNKDDQIFRLPAYTPVADRRKNISQRLDYWRNNTNNACNF